MEKEDIEILSIGEDEILSIDEDEILMLDEEIIKPTPKVEVKKNTKFKFELDVRVLATIIGSIVLFFIFILCDILVNRI